MPAETILSQADSGVVRPDRQEAGQPGQRRRQSLDQYNKIMAQREVVDIPDDAVCNVLNRYLTWVQQNRSDATYKKCRSTSAALRSVGRSRRISQLKKHHVQQWIDDDYKDKFDHLPTHRHIHRRRSFELVLSMDYIDRNPVANMDRKPARKVREFFLIPEQWRELLGAISDRQFADVVAFMLFTGARPQESRVVEARHYDKAHNRLVFSRYESKGEKRQRVIYLDVDHTAREIVERLIKRYPEGAIFRNREGETWTKNAFNCRFRRLKKKLKMPELCAYTCRHSFAHWKLTSGTDSHIVSKLLGHVDGRMLTTRYGHAEQNEAFMLQQA